MTGDDFAGAIERLGTDREAIALGMGVDPEEVDQWCAIGPPRPVALALRLAIAAGWSFDEAFERAAQR